MSCVQLPYLHIQSEALGFQHLEALVLESATRSMNTTHQMSDVTLMLIMVQPAYITYMNIQICCVNNRSSFKARDESRDCVDWWVGTAQLTYSEKETEGVGLLTKGWQSSSVYFEYPGTSMPWHSGPGIHHSLAHDDTTVGCAHLYAKNHNPRSHCYEE